MLCTWKYIKNETRNKSNLSLLGVGVMMSLNPNPGGLVVNIVLPKHKTAVTNLLFIKKFVKICNPPEVSWV